MASESVVYADVDIVLELEAQTHTPVKQELGTHVGVVEVT